MQPSDDLKANIDRTVGLSALRRMSKLAGDRHAADDRAESSTDADRAQQANIDRTVGFSAIRRMSKLAGEINAQERRMQRTGRRLLVVATAIVLFLLLVVLIEPGLITGLLRRLAGD